MSSFNAVLWTLAGLAFIFAMTTLGAATVFAFRKTSSGKYQSIFFGFAAGVMIAASIWSLLIPAIDESIERGGVGWTTASLGFILGIFFLMGIDKIIQHVHEARQVKPGKLRASKRTALLFSAMTLHNIPEGMAVGLAFALGSRFYDSSGTYAYAAAIALALGIGIQNFPEGAAVTMPFYQEGFSKRASFLLGTLTGAVEPVFGFAAAMLVGFSESIMPWCLAFAAGAMMYVVVDEMIPEAHLGDHSSLATLGVMAGFLIMMILDVALG